MDRNFWEKPSFRQQLFFLRNVLDFKHTQKQQKDRKKKSYSTEEHQEYRYEENQEIAFGREVAKGSRI